MSEADRHERALEKVAEIDPEVAERLMNSMQDIAPDLARHAIDFPFGDIFTRPGLDLKSREMINVAALTALGNAAPQLKFHVKGTLNVGCSREEIVEIIIQMAVYAGFPAALNGMVAAKRSSGNETRKQTQNRPTEELPFIRSSGDEG